MKILNKIILSLVLMSSALFANSVGAITAIQGSASIVREAKEIDATLGAKLEEKDSIQTKDETKVQIVFNDETIITIGKNSNFSINEYLYDESKTPTAQFGLMSGAMRTITGKIGKIAPDKFSVQTKTATIGIRGTNFTIIAELDGGSRVYCTFGAISVSVKGESSIVTQGFYVVVSADGKRSEPVKFTPAELDKMRSDSFTDTKDKKEEESKGLKEATETESSTNAEIKKEETEVDSSLNIETQVDTTETENSDLEVEDVTEETTNGVQADVSDTIEKNVQESEAETLEIKGYSVGFNSANTTPVGMTSSTIQLKTQDTSNFDTGDSEFKIGDWILTPSATITSYTSKNQFSGTFASAKNETNQETMTISTTTNTFAATNDDLSSSDIMSWGTWNIDGEHGMSAQITEKLSGLWVAGESPTATSTIAAYNNVTQDITYNGKYKALYLTNNYINTVTGNATLTVNFGYNRLSTLLISNYSGTNSFSYTGMSITDNKIKQDDGYGTRTSGTFYGTDGKSVAGSFSKKISGTESLEGVYQVTTTVKPSTTAH